MLGDSTPGGQVLGFNCCWAKPVPSRSSCLRELAEPLQYWGGKSTSRGRASPPSTALSNTSPAPGCVLIQQFHEKQKSSILIGENSLLPPTERQSVISLSCKTMFIPDRVYLGTNTRSEMCTHLKTQTLHLILYLLVNPHCSQAPFQNTPTGRRKYFYIYI